MKLTPMIFIFFLVIIEGTSEPLKCFVCKDCPTIGIDQLNFLEHCRADSEKASFISKDNYPVTVARSSHPTNETSSLSKIGSVPGTNVTTRAVCYILRLEVDDGIKVSRGCTLYVDNKNATCTKLAKGAKRAGCTLCVSDQCNGAIWHKAVVLNLVAAVAIHVLLSVCHNKFR